MLRVKSRNFFMTVCVFYRRYFNPSISFWKMPASPGEQSPWGSKIMRLAPTFPEIMCYTSFVNRGFL